MRFYLGRVNTILVAIVASSHIVKALPNGREVKTLLGAPCGLIDGIVYRCAFTEEQPLACQAIPSRNEPVCVIPVIEEGAACDDVTRKCMNFLKCDIPKDASEGKCVDNTPALISSSTSS